MRIAFITYEFPQGTGKGGIGTYTSQAANALAAMGWDVHVFAASHKHSGSSMAEGYQLHLTQCSNVNDFRHKVVNIFSAQYSLQKFDIMESPEINGNAWEIKKKYPATPLVVRLHAPGYLVEKLKKKYISFLAKLRFVAGSIRRFKFDLGYWRPYNKMIDEDYQFIQMADFITAPSQAMKEWAVTNWQIPADKITVITNFFLPSADLLNIPISEICRYKRVVFFGRLNVLKGLINATKVMKLILKKYPQWHFKIIGDDGPGPSGNVTMRNWMKGELKEVISRVEFIDGLAYEALPHAIAEAEIVLLPSLFESFSYTCAEAMAAGKAIIASDKCGASYDLIFNNKNGFIIKWDELSTLTLALHHFANNKSEAKKMGKVSLDIIKQYSFAHDCNAIENSINAIGELNSK